jgi:quinol monooxygenase YgiN
MFENATTVQFQPGKVDEALCILRQDIVPTLKEQKGLISLCLLPDRASDRITIISLWSSKAHAQAIEAVSAYRKEVRKLDSLLSQQPAHPVYETRLPEQVYNQMTLN